MSKQLHKNFIDEQVKLLLKSYVDKEIKIEYILSILGIKRRRFFKLLNRCRYPRASPWHFLKQFKLRLT